MASIYETLTANLGRMLTEKQAAYGCAFDKAGAVLAILYPHGIPPAKLTDALAVVRIVDKLFRVAAGVPAGEDPFGDISGYGVLASAARKAVVSNE